MSINWTGNNTFSTSITVLWEFSITIAYIYIVPLFKKKFNITNDYLEAVNQMTNNKMAQRKIRTTNDLQNTTLKLKILLDVNSGAPEYLAIPAPLVTTVAKQNIIKK